MRSTGIIPVRVFAVGHSVGDLVEAMRSALPNVYQGQVQLAVFKPATKVPAQ